MGCFIEIGQARLPSFVQSQTYLELIQQIHQSATTLKSPALHSASSSCAARTALIAMEWEQSRCWIRSGSGGLIDSFGPLWCYLGHSWAASVVWLSRFFSWGGHCGSTTGVWMGVVYQMAPTPMPRPRFSHAEHWIVLNGQYYSLCY